MEKTPNQDDNSFIEITSAFHDEYIKHADPVVLELFEYAKTIESRLGSVTNSPSDALSDTLSDLNDYSYDAGVCMSEVLFTGKLRIPIMEGYSETEIEAIINDQFGNIGLKSSDDCGNFYHLYNTTIACSTFDIQNESYDTEGSKIILNFCPSVDEYSNNDLLYAYLDDVELLLPLTPSLEKIEHDLDVFYPEIKAQLDTLPRRCEDDKLILENLKNFVLHINWAKYRDLDTAGKESLLNMIGDYAYDRLGFDNFIYKVLIEGEILGESKNGDLFSEFKSKITIFGEINGLRLNKDPSSRLNEDKYVLFVQLDSANEIRRSGVSQVFIPPKSILKYKNLRNKDTFVQPTKLYSSNFNKPTSREYSQSNNVDEQNKPDNTPQGDDSRYEDGPLAEYLSLEEEISKLYDKLDPITTRLYHSNESLDKAVNKINRILDDFNSVWGEIGNNVELKAEGVGIVTPHIKIDNSTGQDGDSTSMVLNINMSRKDIFAEARGIYVGSTYIWLEVVDTSSCRLNVSLMLTNKAVGGYQSNHPIDYDIRSSPAVPFVSVSTQTHTLVDLDKQKSTLSLEPLNRMRKIDEALKIITVKAPNDVFLPYAIMDLEELFSETSPAEWTSLSDISLLNRIGESGKNEHISNAVLDAISAVMKNGKYTISGPAYTSEGKKVMVDELYGELVDLVLTGPNIATTEPLIYFIANIPDKEDPNVVIESVFYIPVSSVERLLF